MLISLPLILLRSIFIYNPSYKKFIDPKGTLIAKLDDTFDLEFDFKTKSEVSLKYNTRYLQKGEFKLDEKKTIAQFIPTRKGTVIIKIDEECLYIKGKGVGTSTCKSELSELPNEYHFKFAVRPSKEKKKLAEKVLDEYKQTDIQKNMLSGTFKFKADGILVPVIGQAEPQSLIDGDKLAKTTQNQGKGTNTSEKPIPGIENAEKVKTLNNLPANEGKNNSVRDLKGKPEVSQGNNNYNVDKLDSQGNNMEKEVDRIKKLEGGMGLNNTPIIRAV